MYFALTNIDFNVGSYGIKLNRDVVKSKSIIS